MSFFPFRSIYYKPNLLLINRYLEKYKRKDLKLEEILDEDDLVLDLKQSNQSHMSQWYNIDYIVLIRKSSYL